MGRKDEVEERLGGARGGGAWSVGMVADIWSVIKTVPDSLYSLASATSLQFLRLCLRVGTEKKDRKPFLHFSRSFCQKPPSLSKIILPIILIILLSSRSVRGGLWSASHKEEEEEEGRRGGRERRREAVLFRLCGETSIRT